MFVLMTLAAQLVAPPSTPDSARAYREARSAQAAFERARRRLLPVTTAGLGRCDVRIGRFCYWYDEAEPQPPPEPPAIVGLRERFLARLDSLAAVSPRDAWITAQRVRYLVEAERPDEAVEAALACGAGWRCAAMTGFALHAGQRFAAADSAFSLALAAMPPEERCRWTDLTPLLESPARGPYHRLGCAGRDSANAVLLWLAAPLHATGARDLRTEIFARRALAAMIEGAVTHHVMSAGTDYAAMLLRYGWAVGYGRRHDPLRRPEEIDVVGHEAKPAYAFLAWRPGRALASADRPQFRYAPRYLHQLGELEEVQVARFRRADTLLVAVGYRAGGDSLFLADSAWGRAVLSSASGEVRGSAGLWGASSAALVRAAGGADLVSLELVDSASGTWRRYRDTLPPGPSLVSDLLVFRADSALPASLEEAAGRMSGSLEFPGDAPIGVYWETYLIVEDTSAVPLRLTVTPAGEGWFRRVGRSLGAGWDRRQIELEWTAAGANRGALELDLSRLPEGRYRIRLEVRGRSGAAAVREIRLR